MNTANSMKPTELFRLPKGTNVWVFADGVDGRPSVCRVIYQGVNDQLHFLTSDSTGTVATGVLPDGTTGIFRYCHEAVAALTR